VYKNCIQNNVVLLLLIRATLTYLLSTISENTPGDYKFSNGV